MASIFGHGADAARLKFAHQTQTDAETEVLAKRYLQCGLMHGVSFSDFLGYGTDGMVANAGTINGSFASFVADWGDFISGAKLPFGPSPRALTSVQAPHHLCSLSYNQHTQNFTNCSADARAAQVAYWRNLARNFDRQGSASPWTPLLFDYTVDEPSCHPADGRWDVLHRRAPMVKEADPRLRVLVTTTAEAAQYEGAEGLIDMWVPIINDLSPKPRKPQGGDAGKSCSVSCHNQSLASDQRSQYDKVAKPGNLFTYQSCMSYGCGPTSTCAKINRSGCELGWPSCKYRAVQFHGFMVSSVAE